MTIAHARRIVLVSRPDGRARLENFRMEEVDCPVTPPGGVLLRTVFLSLDPYMRGRMESRASYAPPVEIGAVMEGECVAEVIASEHPDHRIGDLVLAKIGWCSHAASNGAGLRTIDPGLAPPSTRLGVLGMPGFTAYAGLNIIGQPKPGETVVVAAASGPVGSMVGQLAKQAGARAVGIAGGPDKCRYLVAELGFDAAIDHRDPGMPAALAAACPRGIDVYFENVGGAIWQAVLPLLNRFARVPVCGLIGHYDAQAGADADHLPATMREILSRSLMVRGFINYEFADAHFATFLERAAAGIRSGRVRYREDITEGLENAPAAFLGLLAGKNFGKALVRVAEPTVITTDPDTTPADGDARR